MCSHSIAYVDITVCTHFIYVPASIFTNWFLLIIYSSLNHSKMRYSLCEYCGDISYCLLPRSQLFSSIYWQKFVLNISSKTTTFSNIKTSHSSYMLVVLHILLLQSKLSYIILSHDCSFPRITVNILLHCIFWRRLIIFARHHRTSCHRRR